MLTVGKTSVRFSTDFLKRIGRVKLLVSKKNRLIFSKIVDILMRH